MKIISLIASSTEIICAIGYQHALVGRSHECDYPPNVKDLPLCTEVKFQTDGRSYEIDQRVKAIVAEGLSVYKVLPEMLEKLQPDLIVTQTQCEVCAVSAKDVADATCQLVSSAPQVVSLHTDALPDLWRDIRKVAAALGDVPAGERLIERLEQRLEILTAQGAAQPHKPRVAYIEWIDPLMAGGNWMPELIERAGGMNLFGRSGTHSPWMQFEELLAADPDVIIVAPCGFDIARTQEEMPVLTQRPEWPSLKAVQSKCVYLADGNQYFNRPGPRLIESLEILLECFHPERCSGRHEGVGWVRSDGDTAS